MAEFKIKIDQAFLPRVKNEVHYIGYLFYS